MKILDRLREGLPTRPRRTPPPPVTEATGRQLDILRWMADFTKEHGYPPTVRDIGGAFAIESPNGVCCHLKALAKKGYLRGRRNTARGYTVAGLEVRVADTPEGRRLAEAIGGTGGEGP